MDRLRQRADFLAVANGARVSSAAFVVQGRRREDDGPIRVGFTVSRKNGTATERNRIGRRLRELVKLLDVISMRPHSDYVLVGRRAALNRDFATMLDDLRSALLRLDRQASKQAKASSSELNTGSRKENVSQMEKQRAAQQAQSELAKPAPQPGTTTAPATTPQTGAAPAPSANAPAANQPASAAPVSRATAIASTPRVKIDTPRLSGSISLKGARIDDLSLVQFRETVDPSSPPIVLYSPSGTAEPYYAEFGWVPAAGSTIKLLDRDTLWQQEGTGSLTPSSPVVLKYDNGDGLTFRRTISIDDRYLFSIKDDVTNVGNAPVTLYPFALISRHGTPQVSGYYILHEGLIGYLGDQGLQEYGYKKIDDAKQVGFKVTNGWLGITDKYWASALLPDTSAQLQAR